MTPTQVLDCIGKFSGVGRPNGLDLATRTSEVLKSCVRVVTAPCWHGVTLFPACRAIVDDDRVFVAMKALTLFAVCDKMVSCQLFAELLWKRSDSLLAAVRSVVSLAC